MPSSSGDFSYRPVSLLSVGVGSFLFCEDDALVLPKEFFPNEPKAETWRSFVERIATIIATASDRGEEDSILAMVQRQRRQGDGSAMAMAMDMK